MSEARRRPPTGRRLKAGAVHHTASRLKLAAKRAKRVEASVGDGALRARAKRQRRMRFKVKVTDTKGKTTKIVVRAP